MRILYVFQDRTSEESALVTAFLTLRRLTLLAPSQFLEESIRGLYKAYIRQAQNVTVFTLPHINLLRQCGVELLGFNTKLSYELAFVYIRQLATQLRNAITAKGRATYKVVYSWQFIQGLKFWTDALCAYHPRKLKQGAHAIDQAINQQIAASLPSLVYPLVQVITGTIGLMPNHLYFPLRFHCVRMLLQISRDTGMYIPTASYVLEVLQSRELNRKPLPSTLKAFPFETHIQCPKSYEHSQVYVDGIMDQVTDITLEFMTQQAANIAFPEIIMPLVAELKRFVKANPKAKIVRPLRHLMEKVRHHCDFIEQERSRVDWAPGDYHMVDTFLSTTDIGTTPLPKYYEGHIRVKQQQLKLLKTANREA
ncbi:Nucleolar Complex 2 protein [Dimargaris xerosporica]|nr:Nucleolar Complex 2 protein [Dimargaris xerosporica]